MVEPVVEENPKGLTDEKIIEIVRAHPGRPTGELAKLFNLSPKRASERLNRLRIEKRLNCNQGPKRQNLWYAPEDVPKPESKPELPGGYASIKVKEKSQ